MYLKKFVASAKKKAVNTTPISVPKFWMGVWVQDCCKRKGSAPVVSAKNAKMGATGPKQET